MGNHGEEGFAARPMDLEREQVQEGRQRELPFRLQRQGQSRREKCKRDHS